MLASSTVMLFLLLASFLLSYKNVRCVPNHVLMHYSMMFCSLNSASSVHTENSKNKKCTLNTQMMHEKHEVWNDGHFMHSTAAALITSRKGEGLSDSEY